MLRVTRQTAITPGLAAHKEDSTASNLGLYTCRAYQDRMRDEVHDAILAGKLPDLCFI